MAGRIDAMTYLDHKDGELQLTTIERAIEAAQERENCTTCDNAQNVNGYGARVCCLDHDTGAVLAGEILCEDYV